MDIAFDLDGVFDEDYLHFHGPMLEARVDDDISLIRELGNVRSGMRVLDAPCGHGRLANRFAALGCEVVGVDRSQLFLDLAEEEARRQANRPQYQQGDLRHLPVSGKFDVAFCWFSSFGYFEDDEDNRRVLEQFRQVIRPGGKLLIEQANPLMVLRSVSTSDRPVVHKHEVEGDILLDEVAWDAAFGGSVTKRTIVRNGSTRRTWFFVRMLTPPEMRSWLAEAGFRDISITDEGGSPLGLDSQRMVVVANV